MGVLLGGLSSAIYGVADFLGGEGAKRVSAASIVLWAGVVSFPLILLVGLVVGGDIETSDLWLGAGGGTAGAFGLVALFAGLGKGHAAAVAPAAAAFSGIFPVVVALASGDLITTMTWLGVMLAVPAILLSSWVAEPGDVPLGGIWYGLAAGVGFGVYTVLLDATSKTSGLLPLIPARAATMLVVLLMGATGTWKLVGIRRLPKAIVGGNGLLDVTGNVTLLLALRAGALAPVAVAASFYPAVTVLMARIVNKEHLRGRQILGLALTLLALAAIAIG